MNTNTLSKTGTISHSIYKVGQVFFCDSNPSVCDKIRFYEITSIKNGKITFKELAQFKTHNKKPNLCSPTIGMYISSSLSSKIIDSQLILKDNSILKPTPYTVLIISKDYQLKTYTPIEY